MNPKQSFINSLTPSLSNLTTAKKKNNFSAPSSGMSSFGSNTKSTIGQNLKLTSPTYSAISNPYGQKNTTITKKSPEEMRYAAVTPSTPSATNTTPTTNNYTGASKGTQLPASGQAYASSLSGIRDSVSTIQTGIDGLKQKEEKDKPKEESAYLTYLRSMFNPEEARRAQENVNNLNKMQSDEIARNRKEQERIQKNESGMIERGQNYLSTNSDRESAKALADMAIAKGYSTDILNQFTDAGKSIYEAEEAMRKEAESPLTIEEAKALGLPFGTTMAEARLAGVIPSGASDEEAINDSTVFAYADLIGSGQMKIENVPESYRGAVAQAVGLNGPQQTMSPYQEERLTRNLNSIEDLMGQVSGWNTGMGSLIAVIPGTPAANFKADVNTLSANIAFGELTAMREASKTGGALGAVSERELTLLEAALGSLDRAQSPGQFKESLQTIKDSIERWKAAVNQNGGFGGGESGGDGGLWDF